MNFIERWFNLSPDNGSGATEALFLLAAVLLVVAVAYRGRIAAFLKRRTKDE